MLLRTIISGYLTVGTNGSMQSGLRAYISLNSIIQCCETGRGQIC